MANIVDKYKVNTILNYDWLKEHDVILSVEENTRFTFRTLFCCIVINEQLKHLSKPQSAKAIAHIFNISDKTVKRWHDADWKINKIYDRQYKLFVTGQPKTGNELFEIKILSRDKKQKILGRCITSIGQIENTSFVDYGQSKVLFDPIKISQLRESEQTRQENYIVDLSTDEKVENVIRDICHLYASGLLTIVESCERYKLTYIQFLEILTKDELYYQMYQTACRLANQFHSSRQLSQVDNLIFQILAKGCTTNETVTYEKQMIPGQLEPKWIEKRKSVTKRDLSINEIMLLKSLLLKIVDISQLTTNTDEFSNMSEEELINYVNDKQDEIKSMVRLNVTKE